MTKEEEQLHCDFHHWCSTNKIPIQDRFRRLEGHLADFYIEKNVPFSSFSLAADVRLLRSIAARNRSKKSARIKAV